MITVYDVPASSLIKMIAQKLSNNKNIFKPKWSDFVKTGAHKEKIPMDENWWFTRAASVLRKIYLLGPIGSSKLASKYGGFSDRGSKPNKAIKGSKNIIRNCLIQLETAGYLTKVSKKGRKISILGNSFLESAAKEIHTLSNKIKQ